MHTLNAGRNEADRGVRPRPINTCEAEYTFDESGVQDAYAVCSKKLGFFATWDAVRRRWVHAGGWKGLLMGEGDWMGNWGEGLFLLAGRRLGWLLRTMRV